MNREPINDDWSYVGDGAYVRIEDWGRVTIATHDGYRTSNIVYLEPTELVMLFRFLNRDLPKQALSQLTNVLQGRP